MLFLHKALCVKQKGSFACTKEQNPLYYLTGFRHTGVNIAIGLLPLLLRMGGWEISSVSLVLPWLLIPQLSRQYGLSSCTAGCSIHFTSFSSLTKSKQDVRSNCVSQRSPIASCGWMVQYMFCPLLKIMPEVTAAGCNMWLEWVMLFWWTWWGHYKVSAPQSD